MTSHAGLTSKRRKVFDGLVDELRQSIESGDLVPGMAIPSENDLVRSHNLSRVSIRSALQVLEDEGLVVKKPGKGRFVRDVSLPGGLSEEIMRPVNIGLDIAFDMPWYGRRIADAIRSGHSSGWNHRLVLVDSKGYDSLKPDVIDGLIVGTVSEVNDCNRVAATLLGHGIIPVLFNRISEDERVSYVAVNYRKEAASAVRTLQQQGHKRIGVITESKPHMHGAVSLRYVGYCDAMELPVNHTHPDTFFVTNDDTATEEIARFLKDSKITALFVTYGFIAPYVFRAADLAGRKYPDDLKILCFDDISHLYGAFSGSFSYVKMPLEQMAQDAADFIVRRASTKESDTASGSAEVLKQLYTATIEDAATGESRPV